MLVLHKIFSSTLNQTQTTKDAQLTVGQRVNMNTCFPAGSSFRQHFKHCVAAL